MRYAVEARIFNNGKIVAKVKMCIRDRVREVLILSPTVRHPLPPPVPHLPPRMAFPLRPGFFFPAGAAVDVFSAPASKTGCF